MHRIMCLHHNPSLPSSLLPPSPSISFTFFFHSSFHSSPSSPSSFSFLSPSLSQGYLTHNGKVNLPRVQLILTGTPCLQDPLLPCFVIDMLYCSTELGKVEDEIFKKRREKELEFRRRDQAKRRRMVSPNSESIHTFHSVFTEYTPYIHTHVHTYI